eukprot:7382430-Prymnesium_polylepis.1
MGTQELNRLAQNVGEGVALAGFMSLSRERSGTNGFLKANDAGHVVTFTVGEGVVAGAIAPSIAVNRKEFEVVVAPG